MRGAVPVFLAVSAIGNAVADDWKTPAPAKTARRVEVDHVVTVVDATPPGIVAVQGYGLASIAGCAAITQWARRSKAWKRQTSRARERRRAVEQSAVRTSERWP